MLVKTFFAFLLTVLELKKLIICSFIFIFQTMCHSVGLLPPATILRSCSVLHFDLNRDIFPRCHFYSHSYYYRTTYANGTVPFLFLLSNSLQDPTMVTSHAVCSTVFLLLPQYNLGMAIFRGASAYQLMLVGEQFLGELRLLAV